MHSGHLSTWVNGESIGYYPMGSDSYDHTAIPPMDSEAETAFVSGSTSAENDERGMELMNTLEKDVKRLEMQIGQLVSIIANLNDRLNRIEDIERRKKIMTIHNIPLGERV